MKNILLPTRPQFCEKILSGEKTLELRKTTPKEVPFKVYMYCTQNGGDLILDDDDKRYYFKPECYNANDAYLNGKVIAEYVVDRIDKLYYDTIFEDDCEPYMGYDYNDCDISKSCLTPVEIEQYLNGRGTGLFYHVSDLKIYATPKPLSDFVNAKGETIIRAPQSWQYVELKGE